MVNQTDENRFSIQASLKSVDHLLDVNEALQAKFVEEIRRVTPDFNQRGPLLHRLYNSPYKPQFFAAKALPKVIQAIKDPAKKAAAQRIWLINTDNSLGKVF
ncbi:MAG: hypothetical protein VKJ06_09005 [Vampirovibrionales bacterium]|nr:hypothetical protein [Vampirovibrionales bacterium]